MWSDDEGDDLDACGSDVEYGDDPLVNTEKPKPSHTVITAESLAMVQNEDLQKVVDMLGVRIHQARTLLIHYRWDVDVLFSHLAEMGKEELFRRAGISESSLPVSTIPRSITCEVCFEDVALSDATQMSCGHAYCNECWSRHFIVNINEAKSRRLRCMSHKCGAICDEDKVRKVLESRDIDALERYERSLLESYIEDNSKVKWCSSVPHCGNAIKVEGEPYCEIECICSQQFCFNCMNEPHSPCSCLMWQLWDKKCRDESETNNWMAVHTKPCPKCQKPVEKAGGCNLVTCVCGRYFCWLCGAATGHSHTWTNIEGHSCGRYKEEYEREAAKAERQLKRYQHYYNRWKAHMDSMKLEARQVQTVQAKIEALESSALLVKDYSWLRNGLQMLFRARRVLSFTYPFAYFMFGNDLFKDDITPTQNTINQNLFEDQQQQFEIQVERLSRIIETPIELNGSEKDVNDLRFELISVTTLTNNLCRRMYDVIENDLLDSLMSTTHHIAPYTLQGVERAASICDQATGSSSDTTKEVEPSKMLKRLSEDTQESSKRQRLC